MDSCHLILVINNFTTVVPHVGNVSLSNETIKQVSMSDLILQK